MGPTYILLFFLVPVCKFVFTNFAENYAIRIHKDQDKIWLSVYASRKCSVGICPRNGYIYDKNLDGDTVVFLINLFVIDSNQCFYPLATDLGK
jgi:hypothetical protein